jgi:hypothetical protein
MPEKKVGAIRSHVVDLEKKYFFYFVTFVVRNDLCVTKKNISKKYVVKVSSLI